MVWNAEKLRPWKRATEQRLLTCWVIVGIYLQVINNPDRDSERGLWCHNKHCVFMNTGSDGQKGNCHTEECELVMQTKQFSFHRQRWSLLLHSHRHGRGQRGGTSSKLSSSKQIETCSLHSTHPWGAVGVFEMCYFGSDAAFSLSALTKQHYLILISHK